MADLCAHFRQLMLSEALVALLPPQLGQCSMSLSKTRLINLA